MGNFASCTLRIGAAAHGKASARVIFPCGEIKQFNQLIKAAEIMLEIPNYFLINSTALQLGRRFSALNADEDLQTGYVYVMFPMQRLHSVVTTADMGALYLAAKRGSTNAGKVRVLPACSGEVEYVVRVCREKVILEGVEELFCEFKHTRSVSRSKKPLLDTIVEEPVLSRSFNLIFENKRVDI